MKKWAPYIVIVLLVVVLILSLTHPREVVVETHTTDTVTIVRVDTIRERFPHFVYEKVLDTIFIEKVPENGLKLPITQRYYSTDLYQAWVSGYKPSLDSINVFRKTVTNTITNTVTKEIYPKTTDLYLNGGVDYIGKQFAPNIGLSVKFKNNMVLGGSVGLYDKNLYYGLKLGVKLNMAIIY